MELEDLLYKLSVLKKWKAIEKEPWEGCGVEVEDGEWLWARRVGNSCPEEYLWIEQNSGNKFNVYEYSDTDRQSLNERPFSTYEKAQEWADDYILDLQEEEEMTVSEKYEYLSYLKNTLLNYHSQFFKFADDIDYQVEYIDKSTLYNNSLEDTVDTMLDIVDSLNENQIPNGFSEEEINAEYGMLISEENRIEVLNFLIEGSQLLEEIDPYEFMDQDELYEDINEKCYQIENNWISLKSYVDGLNQYDDEDLDEEQIERRNKLIEKANWLSERINLHDSVEESEILIDQDGEYELYEIKGQDKNQLRDTYGSLVAEGDWMTVSEAVDELELDNENEL